MKHTQGMLSSIVEGARSKAIRARSTVRLYTLLCAAGPASAGTVAAGGAVRHRWVLLLLLMSSIAEDALTKMVRAIATVRANALRAAGPTAAGSAAAAGAVRHRWMLLLLLLLMLVGSIARGALSLVVRAISAVLPNVRPAAGPAAAGSAAAAGAVRNRWMLPLLLTGQAMAAMDTSIGNVAAPAIRQDLGISGALLQMVVAGYVLAYAVFLITSARLGDDHGYRRLFTLGVSLFTGSSLICGLAPTTAVLIAGRVAQGFGAALLVPQVLSLIQRHFEGDARARAIGYYSMILGLGSTAGQLLGGIAVTVDLFGLSWRPAFLINVPVGIALLTYAGSVLPDTKGDQPRKLDIIGVCILSASLLFIVIPMTFGREVDWATWTWISLAIGVAGLSLFLRFEKSLASQGGQPLLNLDAMLTPGIRPGLLVVVIGFIGYGGWLFATALYMQSGLQYSPLISGLVFTAYAMGFGISNVKWSSLPPRLLRWTPVAALIVMVFANLLFGLTAVRAGWVSTIMVPLLFLAGSSHGLTFGTTVNQMTQRTAPAHIPAISGLVTTCVQLSIVIGIAALGALYLSTAKAGASGPSSQAMSHVTFVIAAGALVAIGCSIRLATIGGARPAAQPLMVAQGK